jgi:hypothetical protein
MTKARPDASGSSAGQSRHPATAKPLRSAAPFDYCEAMRRYAAEMESVKRSLGVIDAAILGLILNGEGDLAKLQMAALVLRQVLEAIAFGSLVLNKSLYDQAHQGAEREWSAKRLLNKIEKLNARFYPEPISEIEHSNGARDIVAKTFGFLTKDEFVVLYDKCSGIIHRKNPFDSNFGYTDFANSIPTWRSKIVALLNAHELHLPGDTGFYVVHMQEARDHHVHWYRFELAPSGP